MEKIKMSKSSELDRTVKLYILHHIKEDSEGTERNIIDSIEYVKQRFESEWSHEIPRQGYINALTEWLMGIPLSFAFSNYDILQLAIKWGSIPENYTEKQADKILENYWRFMANKLNQLFTGYHVPKTLGE